MKPTYIACLLFIGTFLFACSGQKKTETQNNIRTDSSAKKTVPLTIEDYYKTLLQTKYFKLIDPKDIKIETLDVANGFMQINFVSQKGKFREKISLALWNKRKNGKDLVALVSQHCNSFCRYQDPVFLEFTDDAYQDVTNIHYPEKLKNYLKRRQTDYAKKCPGITTGNATFLPQQGVDIQLVIYPQTAGEQPACPQVLAGLLKYNGEGFNFIEPVENVETKSVVDYFEVLKQAQFFKGNQLKITEKNVGNGYLKFSYQHTNGSAIKGEMTFWNQRKNGKDLVGITQTQCGGTCLPLPPVFLEFSPKTIENNQENNPKNAPKRNYSDVTNQIYTPSLKNWLTQSLQNYQCKATRQTKLVLPVQGMDIRLVAYGITGSCEEKVLGTLKYDGMWFDLVRTQ